jgi:hypothetical protein
VKPLRHLSWENFRATVFVRGEQRVHRVTASPTIELFADGTSNRVGIWLEVPAGTSIPAEISGLAVIDTTRTEKGAKSFLQITTTATSLHRQFYHFMIATVERVVVEKRPAIEAVALELQCFAELLQKKPILSIERQLGLLGELLFLQRLIGKHGMQALDAWVGPLGEPHDFRIANREFEIKTTVAPHRIHTIHGAEQLVPSDSCALFLISVLLGPPGANEGFSLPSSISSIARAMEGAYSRASQFHESLEKSGFRDSDVAHYQRRYMMRRPLALIPVDDQFPAITRPTIQRALGPLAQRIESIQYEVDVESLEHEEGDEAFESLIQQGGSGE